MSFLNGPADCGPVNPLAQLSKTSAIDNSLQRDRFVGPSSAASSSQLRHLPPSASSSSSTSRPPPAQLGQSRSSPQQPFDLASLQNALLGNQNQQRAPSPAQQQHRQQQQAHPSAWIEEINAQQQQHHQSPGPWQQGMEEGWNRAAQPSPLQHHQQHSDPHFQAAWEQSHAQQQPQHHQQQYSPYQQQQQQFGGMGMGMGMGMMGSSMMGGGFMPQLQPQTLDKGKGREVNWESQFDQYAAQAPVAPKEEEAKPAEVVEEEALKAKVVDELEEIWQSHQDNPALDADGGEGDLRSWEAEFSQFASGDVASAYEELEADQARRYEEEMGDDVLGTTDATGFPRLGTYTFENTNPYLTHPNPLALAHGMVNTLSSLSDKALALEAALQSSTMPRDTLEEAAAWKELGDCQTQDEKELAGTRALEESVRVYERIREKGGEASGGVEVSRGMGEALMSLAISYTNESYDQAAYLTLHRHLSLLHPKHAKPLPPSLGGSNQTNPWAIHGLLTECFLNAAREQQGEGRVDPGTQMALGLLYYSNGEFELSADCWSAALSVTPEDFLLWNRLGATLANGGRPEEAIDAYRRALDLNPTYTRSIYNLGVSCLNIGIYREAAEHLLTALSLHQTSQQNGGGPELLSKDEAVNQSQNLWSTLRRAFFAMDRPDLAEKAVVGADLRIFGGEGFEF